jgi:anti-sigma B factor antagonist
MRLRHRHKAGIEFVDFEGEIKLEDFQQAGNPLEGLLGSACYSHIVVFDFSMVPRIDSSGIGWLVVVNKHFKQQGGTLILHSLQRTITENLRTLGLLGVLNLAEDADSARARAAARLPMLVS